VNGRRVFVTVAAILVVNACEGSGRRVRVRPPSESPAIADWTLYVVPKQAWDDSLAVYCDSSRIERVKLEEEQQRQSDERRRREEVEGVQTRPPIDFDAIRSRLTEREQEQRALGPQYTVFETRMLGIVGALATDSSQLSPSGYSDPVRWRDEDHFLIAVAPPEPIVILLGSRRLGNESRLITRLIGFPPEPEPHTILNFSPRTLTACRR